MAAHWTTSPLPGSGEATREINRTRLAGGGTTKQPNASDGDGPPRTAGTASRHPETKRFTACPRASSALPQDDSGLPMEYAARVMFAGSNVDPIAARSILIV